MRRQFWRPQRRRSRATGCLLWLVIVIIVLIVLSVLFGGFQNGKKSGLPAAHPVTLTHPAAQASR